MMHAVSPHMAGQPQTGARTTHFHHVFLFAWTQRGGGRLAERMMQTSHKPHSPMMQNYTGRSTDPSAALQLSAQSPRLTRAGTKARKEVTRVSHASPVSNKGGGHSCHQNR